MPLKRELCVDLIGSGFTGKVHARGRQGLRRGAWIQTLVETIARSSRGRVWMDVPAG